MILPYKFSFIRKEYPIWDYLDMTVDLFFFIDVIITFFTPYLDSEGKPVVSMKKIACRYLKFWFWLDFFSVLPVDQFMSIGQLSVFLRFSRLPRLYKITKIAKVFRTFKSMRSKNSIWNKVYDFLLLHPGLDRLVINLFSIFLFCHIFACIWHFFADISRGTSSWIWRLELRDSSNFERYLASLYWIIQTVITVGYGDVGAESTTERIIAIIAMCAGVIFFSLTIGSISSIISETDAKNTAYEAKLNLLMQIKSKYQISDDIFKKVQRALKYGVYRSDETAIEFVNSLPKDLKIEASAIIFKNYIKGLKFFEGASKEFISDIGPYLKEVKFNKGEVIYSEEDYASEVFFLKSGIVALVLQDFAQMPFISIFEGYYFGEIDLLFSESRKFTTIAETDVECLTLEKIHFQKIILHKYRKVGNEMRENAERRRKRQLDSYNQAKEYCRRLKEIGNSRRTNINKNPSKNFLSIENGNESFVQRVTF